MKITALIDSVIPLLLIIGICLFVVGLLMKKTGNKKGTGKIFAKELLTKNEQPMYFRLVEALPEHVVLAQVSFSALLTTRDMTARNRFDRKIADFVICTKAFKVIAAIELDDSSHNGRESKDAERDQLLTNAGYRVLRYKRVPDIDKLRADIIPQPSLPSGASDTLGSVEPGF